MRVIAFSCTHLCSPETQMELQDHNYNYDNIRKLIDLCLENPPDRIVNLGDFIEPMYDTSDDMMQLKLKEIPRYNKLRGVIRLFGNHDELYGNIRENNFTDIDEVRYEHGHHIINTREFQTRDKYVESIREATKNLGFNLVHGHTHFPEEGNPLDVGSITFTGTYGEIIDGKEFYIRRV